MDGIEGKVHIIKEGDHWQVEHERYSAEASSTLKPEIGYSYEARNIAGPEWNSGKFVPGLTAWSEGVKGHGVGESLTLTVDKPLPLDKIKIFPGYGKSDELFKANGRPSELKITFNGEHSFSAKLKDRNRMQIIRVPEGYRKPVKTVELKIAKVYPGSKYSDTCISHVRLIGRLAKDPMVRGAR